MVQFVSFSTGEMMRILAVFALIPLFGVIGCTSGSIAPPMHSAKQLELSAPIADFELIERNGETVTKADLAGKVWVAAFVFTRCTGPCPQVTGTMARLQKELADIPEARLVTFTVDPSRDDPDALREYAKHFGADTKRWLFLTGSESEIHGLLEESFMVPVEKVADSPVGEEFNHSTKLAVVDKQGNLRGYFDGKPSQLEAKPDAAFQANLNHIKQFVDELAREG